MSKILLTLAVVSTSVSGAGLNGREYRLKQEETLEELPKSPQVEQYYRYSLAVMEGLDLEEFAINATNCYERAFIEIFFSKYGDKMPGNNFYQ